MIDSCGTVHSDCYCNTLETYKLIIITKMFTGSNILSVCDKAYHTDKGNLQKG